MAVERFPAPAGHIGATVLGASVFAAAAYLGRATVPDGLNFAVIWPAGGVAVLWLLLTSSRLFVVNAAVLGAVGFAVNYVTGVPPRVAAVFLFTNVLQAAVATYGLRRLCPDLWGCGGNAPLTTPQQLGRMLASLVVASRLGTTAGVIGLELFGPHPATALLLWFSRNLCGLFLITIPGLLVGYWWTHRNPRAPSHIASVGGRLEFLAATVVTVVLYVSAFGYEASRLPFPILVVSVWIGARFSPLVSALHSTVIGIAAVGLTLAAVGPFAYGRSIVVASQLVQYFIVVVMVTGLALATGRAARLGAEARLAMAERESSERAAMFDAVFASMTEGVNVMDEDGNFLVTNDAATQLMGFRTPTVPGNTDVITAYYPGPSGTVIPPEEKPSYRALHGETVRQMDVVYRSPNGEEKTFSVSGAPLPIGSDGKRRAVLVFSDVSAERIAKAELAAFAWVVAHDLKSPLTAIELWVELATDELKRSGALGSEFALKFTDRVSQASDRMRQLINDLIQHASTKSVDLVLTDVNLEAVLRRVVEARGCDAFVTVADLPEVRGDEFLLRLAFDNVIGNALKYVVPGNDPQVRISGLRVGDEVVIRVADEGIGMPAGAHDQMFAEFQRGPGLEYEGTGLGLAIVRRVLTRHGGLVTAYDNPAGRGTVVEFRLPQPQRPEAA